MTLAGPRIRLLTSLQVAFAPHRSYQRWRDAYGATFLARAVNGDVLCTADPAVIRDLFRKTDDQVGPFRPEVLTPLVGPLSLFTLTGPAHARERKLLMPPFHGARMRAYGDSIVRSAEESCQRIEPGTSLRMSDTMLEVSLAVICRAIFGVDHDLPRWMDLLRGPIDHMSPMALFIPATQQPFVPAWRRFVAARNALDVAIHEIIAQRRASATVGEDILSRMLGASYEDGEPMRDGAVRDELVSLLFAGHETTQISMAWALRRIHDDPELLRDLRDEVDGCDGSPEALAKLPLLAATVDETLRIDPIVPDVLRTMLVDANLGGIDVSAGSFVSPIAALVHRDPDLYPEPEAFRPHRFLERSYRPWEFLPFGGGTRRCIGAALATYEMKLVLGTFLRKLVLENDGPDWMVRRSVTMGPKRGAPMRCRGRRAA
jgi:cytochrome P450